LERTRDRERQKEEYKERNTRKKKKKIVAKNRKRIFGLGTFLLSANPIRGT
jgi:hypothetical protein